MNVIKNVIKSSDDTLEKLKNFQYEAYVEEMNSEDNREKMKDMFQKISKYDNEAIELSKQIRIK